MRVKVDRLFVVRFSMSICFVYKKLKWCHEPLGNREDNPFHLVLRKRQYNQGKENAMNM